MANIDWNSPVTQKTLGNMAKQYPSLGKTQDDYKATLTELVTSGKLPKEKYAELATGAVATPIP